VLRLDLTNREQPFSRATEDFLTISNWAPANSRDDDLGGSSPLVIPDQGSGTKTPRLLITAGKDGRVYLMNRDNLGGLDGQLQKMRITSGNRVAPTYFRDDAGRQFIYITGTNEPTFPSYGTFIDWEEDSRYLAAQEQDRPRAALGTGPTLVEF